MNQENRRILIVDDEPEIRLGYRTFLNPPSAPMIESSRSGSPQPTASGSSRFEITEAENGDRALTILLEELSCGRRFAGAIVDVRMPGKLDGLQFIREAWKSDPSLLVVVSTAYQDRSVDEIDRVFSAQFQDQWDYLNKPFSSGEIVQKARQLVSSWNRREREKQYTTRIREQQNALVAQERLAVMGRLARSVGHEFGNVLQPLITKLEVTRRKCPEELGPAFEEMIEAAELGSHICKDLLTFARESHESSTPPTIPLLDPISRAVRLLSHSIKSKDARVELLVRPDLWVQVHEPRFVQVMINLLSNALDAIPTGGTVRVEASPSPNGAIQLMVVDSGAGVPADIIDLLFQPLFTTKGNRGNGLGLSVCRQILESYGAKIRVESEGNGTSIIIEMLQAPEIWQP